MKKKKENNHTIKGIMRNASKYISVKHLMILFFDILKIPNINPLKNEINKDTIAIIRVFPSPSNSNL